MNSKTWMPQAKMAVRVEKDAPASSAPSPTSQLRNPFRAKWPWAPVLVIMALAAFFLLLSGAGTLATAKEKTVAAEGEKPGEGSTDFEGGVRLALRQSPYFTKSSLEIDIKRMDEADSRYGLFPSLTFRTYYYMDRPKDIYHTRPYSLSFTSDAYNPFESYFTLQVRKIFTQMAILAHLKAISEGLNRLGKMFLELDLLKRSQAYQEELIDLAKQNLAYAENRLNLGTGTSLEARVATQELELAKAEKERILASQAKVLGNLKSLLGLKAGEKFTPDLRDVRRQVLGQFDPTTVTLEQVRNRSYELKMQDLSKKLQAYNVTLAKTSVLPNLFVLVQTPDPLSATTGYGLYFAIGLQVPVWDGLKRIRNISRQKAILRQTDSARELKELDLDANWLAAQEDLRNAVAARKLAQTQEELAQLKERQSAIRYHSGHEPLPVLVEGRKGYLEAMKNTALKSLDYDVALLNLRQLSGDLSYTYVNESSWQN